jgi:hypothetical protein
MGCGQHRAFLLGSDRLPSDSQSWRRLNLDRDGTFSIPHLRPSSCWLLAAALATALAAALHQCGVEVCRCAETIIPWARISWMRLRNSVASRLTAIPSAPATASTYYNISPRPHYRHLRIGRGDFFSSRIHLTFEANSQYLSFLMLVGSLRDDAGCCWTLSRPWTLDCWTAMGCGRCKRNAHAQTATSTKGAYIALCN